MTGLGKQIIQKYRLSDRCEQTTQYPEYTEQKANALSNQAFAVKTEFVGKN